jgi:hypothetical protein
MKEKIVGRNMEHIQKILYAKEGPWEQIVTVAVENTSIISSLLEGLLSKKEVYRFNCFKVLQQISKDAPEVLYEHWDKFVDLLKTDHAYHCITALTLLANLTKLDEENRFKQILDLYYSLLDHRSMIVACYVARNSGEIVQNKPEFENQITEKLLSVDSTHHEQERIDLIKADIIVSFEQYFQKSQNQDLILQFVEKQMECQSSKTRKVARTFLNRYKRK